MPILHPVFMIIFIFLAVASYVEVYVLEKKQPIFSWVAGVMFILVFGLRLDCGADYPVYKMLYPGFSLYTTYGDVWDKALFRPNTQEIEWLFVLINKLLFDFGMPFYIVTLVMAVITVSLKIPSIYQDVKFPALALLFYFMPIIFFEDGGQMRQGLGIAICVFSFRFIKARNLPMFLVCMYLALGFHKTSVVFIPAYWLVRIPMNSKRILWIIIIAIILSPFEVYRLGGGVFESIAPTELANAYTGYADDKYYGTALESGLNDIIKLFFIFVLVRYDKEGCDNVWWYEYMRNLAVFGLVMFYIFRSNAIFAIRLPGAYMFFMTMFCFPNIVYALKEGARKNLYILFMLYFFLMFFHFGRGNGTRLRFSIDGYKNALWNG